MVDRLTPTDRSILMGKIRSRDTKPEMLVRRMIFRMGYRYRLHRRDLPSAPDLVFSGLRKVIFVHGCFWHQHAGCDRRRAPASKVGYWAPKLAGNAKRDQRSRCALRRAGWSVLTVWECELRSLDKLERRISAFLTRRRPGQR